MSLQRKIELIAQNSPCLILEVLPDGKIEYVNRAFQEYSPQQVVGTSLYSYISRKHHQLVHDGFKKAATDGLAEVEVLAAGPTDERTWYKCRIGSITSEKSGISSLVVVAHDISAHKNLEEKLAHEKNTLLEAQQIAGIGNYEWTLQTNELYWSPQMYSILEIDPSTPPSPELFMSCIPPEHRDMMSRQRDKAFKTGGVLEPAMVKVQANGKIKYVYMTGTISMDKNGLPVRFHGVLQDLTELQKARKTVDDQLQRLKEYAFITSHELRRPVASLLGLTSLFESAGSNEVEIASIVSRIQSMSAEMDTILQRANKVLTNNGEK